MTVETTDLTTKPPRWRVTKQKKPGNPRFPWTVLRNPIPEDDTRIPDPHNDDRTSIESGEHETMLDAFRAAVEGAQLDAPLYTEAPC